MVENHKSTSLLSRLMCNGGRWLGMTLKVDRRVRRCPGMYVAASPSRHPLASWSYYFRCILTCTIRRYLMSEKMHVLAKRKPLDQDKAITSHIENRRLWLTLHRVRVRSSLLVFLMGQLALFFFFYLRLKRSPIYVRSTCPGTTPAI